MRIFWGLIWLVIGFVLIKYSFQLVNTFGHIPWAEQHLGGGGTYTAYKIAGIIVMALALLYMFGGLDRLVAPMGGFFGG